MNLPQIYSRRNRAMLLMSALVFNFFFIAESRAQNRAKDSLGMSMDYWKIWNEGVQEEINEGIEKNRKANAVIKIQGLKAGEEVKIEQLSHDFHFGASIFNFNQLGTAERNEHYKSLFGTVFNQATVPFYWKTFETEPLRKRFREEYWDTEGFWNAVDSPKTMPHWRRPAPDPVINFLLKRGVRIKGHTMIWGNNKWQKPDWLYYKLCPEDERLKIEDLRGIKEFEKLSAKEMDKIAPRFARILKKQYKNRVIDLYKYYRDKIDSWDVVNESAADYHGELESGTGFYNHSVYGYMPGDYTYDAYRTAMEYFNDNVDININDYANDLNYANQVIDLKGHGIRINLMGSQMHLFNPKSVYEIAKGEVNGGVSKIKAVDPVVIREMINTLSKAKIPIAISEITITAGDNDDRGKQIQAQITKNLYRMWFSLKDVVEITWWNIVDDAGAPGEPLTSGLFSRNMEPKPAFNILNELINKDWKTSMTLNVEKNGRADFRGFKGEYLISWKDSTGQLQQRKFYLRNDGDGFEANVLNRQSQ